MQHSLFEHAEDPLNRKGWNEIYLTTPDNVVKKYTHAHKIYSAFTVAELYNLLYSYGICDILLNVEPEKLADYLAEKICQKLENK